MSKALLKEQLAKQVFWADFMMQPSSQEVAEMARKVYPNAPLAQGQSCLHINDLPNQLVKAGAIEEVKDLYRTLLMYQPPFMDKTDVEGDGSYVFESVGSSIIKMGDAMVEGLKDRKISSDDYLELFQIVSEFDMYTSGKAVHPYLKTHHLAAVYKAGKLDVFECLYRRFNDQDQPNGHLIFKGIQDLMAPFFNDRHGLHAMVMEDLKKAGAYDRYALAEQTNHFWTQKDAVIARLTERKDPRLWKEIISVSSEVFGLKRFYPLKKAVQDGSAYAAFMGQIDLFLAAKRQGYQFEAAELKTLLEPVERLCKAVGSLWSRKAPLEMGAKLQEIFDGTNKKTLLQSRRAKNLIESLNELMPGAGWMNYAQQKDKADILRNQLDI